MNEHAHPDRFASWSLEAANPWWHMYHRAGWHVLRSAKGTDGVAVLAIDALGEVLLIETYRVAVDRISLEIPRGNIEPGERPVVAARRELFEETGLDVSEKDLQPLGYVFPDNGLLVTRVHLFLVNLDRPFGVLAPCPRETLGLRMVPRATFARMIFDGTITDGFTLTAQARLAAVPGSPAPSLIEKEIEILDAEGEVLACLRTAQPEWAIAQYLRNRTVPATRWRFRDFPQQVRDIW